MGRKYLIFTLVLWSFFRAFRVSADDTDGDMLHLKQFQPL